MENLQWLGGDQKVSVVQQSNHRPLHKQQEADLDEDREDQLAYTADVQEHWAAQHSQQHTVHEILRAQTTAAVKTFCISIHMKSI